ncbi:MAG: sugar phosphate isomerase/epimerase, partial [Acutalibacteraceae bacterium]|nr:sugar phosphate isomerase/epimerase [Acutalibacteraceae bacterium]
MDGIKIYAFADEASPNIDEQIAALKRNGLQGLEIRNVDGVNVSDITLEKAKEVKKKLSSNGLVTWSIGSPIGKINIENDDFSAHTEKLKHTLEIANILEAEN